MQAYLTSAQELVKNGGYVPLSYSSQVHAGGGNDYYTYWNGQYVQRSAALGPAQTSAAIATANLSSFTSAKQSAAANGASTITWKDETLQTDGSVTAVVVDTSPVEESGVAFNLANAASNATAALATAKAQLSSSNPADPAAPNPALAALIDTSVTIPVNLAQNVPQGCGLNPISSPGLHFIQIITDTGTFFTNLLLYFPSQVAQKGYNFLQPMAFLYTFWTPHTERGDTIFNVQTACATPNNDSCTNGVPLGFSKNNQSGANLATNMPWYISIAIFLQWLISGFYFVILFAAAVLHMIRGKKSTQLNVLTLVPRLIAACF